jgi:GT2 family glycosyltransferase
MNDKIFVSIPTMNHAMTDLLLSDIAQSSIIPDVLEIVDNDPAENQYFSCDIKDCMCLTYVPGENIGVNPAWNHSFAMAMLNKCRYLAILNDDIRIAPNFFKEMLQVFSDKPDAAIVSPSTFRSMDLFESYRKSPVQFTRDPQPFARRVCGWAFVIDMEKLGRIDPIPQELRIYCGDLYYHWSCQRLGFKWYKSYRTFIYHAFSATTKLNPDAHFLNKEERKIYDELIKKESCL